MALFDAYVVVDWSGSSRPTKAGAADSIWFAACIRAGEALERQALTNARTRHEAVARLEQLLGQDFAGRRVLCGFDFPFGYPHGTAARLGALPADWRGLWRRLAEEIDDAPDNANNRMDVASGWNRRLCGADDAFPFWGNGFKQEFPCLRRRGRRARRESDLPERRLCDTRIPSVKTVWQLAGTGSVGSQALLGIPRVDQLRRAASLSRRVAIWPFESGLTARFEKPVVLAEVYPSYLPRTEIAAAGESDGLAGLPWDALQVVALARHFAARDAAGLLSGDFEADPALTADERRLVEREEGWILGVRGPARPVNPSGRPR